MRINAVRREPNIDVDWPMSYVINRPITTSEGQEKVRPLTELSDLLLDTHEYFYAKVPINEDQEPLLVNHNFVIKNQEQLEIRPINNMQINEFAEYATRINPTN